MLFRSEPFFQKAEDSVRQHAIEELKDKDTQTLTVAVGEVLRGRPKGSADRVSAHPVELVDLGIEVLDVFDHKLTSFLSIGYK